MTTLDKEIKTTFDKLDDQTKWLSAEHKRNNQVLDNPKAHLIGFYSQVYDNKTLTEAIEKDLGLKNYAR